MLFRWLAALIAVLQLSACSFTSLGYNTLPSLMVWQTDRYFYLTDAQKSLVNERLTALHRWHRSNELPVYAKFLNQADDRVQLGPIDEATMSEWRATVLRRWPLVAEKMAPGVTELLLSLSPEQLRRARKKLKEDNEKYQKDYLVEGPARLKARMERYTKRAEFFLGSLEDNQIAYLRDISQKLPNNESAWFAERQARQEAFFALVETIQADRANLAQANALVTRYLSELWISKDPQRALVLEGSAKASDQISAAIFRMASADQKAEMRKKFRTYASDFERLAAQ